MNSDTRLSNALFRLSIMLCTFCLFNSTAFAQFENRNRSRVDARRK